MLLKNQPGNKLTRGLDRESENVTNGRSILSIPKITPEAVGVGQGSMKF